MLHVHGRGGDLLLVSSVVSIESLNPFFTVLYNLAGLSLSIHVHTYSLPPVNAREIHRLLLWLIGKNVRCKHQWTQVKCAHCMSKKHAGAVAAVFVKCMPCTFAHLPAYSHRYLFGARIISTAL